MIIVVAAFQAKAGMGKELEEIFKGAIPIVQEEEGAIVYTLHQAVDDPNKFLFYEVYLDQESFDEHNSQPFLRDIMKAARGIIEEKPDICFYKAIASVKR